MWYSESTKDALVKIDDTPLWVRVSSVDAIQPNTDMRRDHLTAIRLRNGDTVVTEKLVDEVVDILSKALAKIL